jgi:hypothetical protein
MGRRSRKRSVPPSPRPSDDPRADTGEAKRPPPPAPAAAQTPRPRTRGRPRLDEAPPAPWGSFPIVELCVLLALVLGIAGIVIWGRQGQIMLACATGLGSLAGLEVSIREHWAGYRSHTTVLAGTVGVAVLAICVFAKAPQPVILIAGATAFASAFWLFRNVFRRRTGGLGFR